MLKRIAGIVAITLGFGGVAQAAPVDTWSILYGYDCVADLYNPIRADGSRDPNGDPVPGTPEWDAREDEHTACTDQRDDDIRLQPTRNLATAQYGEDMYRQPERWNGIRFNWEEFPAYGIPGVPSAEVYLPCSNKPGDCPNLPAGLKRFDPPYPVVVVFHGIIAQYSHHRFITQAFAEHGYLAVGVNGTIPAGSGPNSQRTANGTDVLNWLESAASGIYGQSADMSRVGFAGHSQGGAATQSYQGSPRVHAMIVYDAGDSVSAANVAQPTMFQRTDGGFATPATHNAYPTDRFRARPGYAAMKTRGLDIFNFTARATVHTDWNGYGVGLAGNRLIELLINYYSLAWFDRHLHGRLVLDENGNVVTAAGRTETEERAYRQIQAEDAFNRLTARYFDDSADIHNISMGFWDPELAIANRDPIYGGNIPYQVAGLEVRDRFSPYYQSLCALKLPNYLSGGTGRPDDPVPPKRVADTTADGDMRFIGCPEIPQVVDTDGDGVLDDVDACVNEPGPASNNGCPIVTDTTPDAFSFTSLSGVAQSSVVSSNVVTISGIDAPAPIGIAGGPGSQYRINGGGWTSAAGSITNGQTVQVRHTAASAPGTTVESVLTIGGVQGKFRSTTAGTAGNDTDPDAFSFGTKTNEAPSTEVVSDAIILSGYDAPAPVTAGSGTQYSLGCSQDNWTSAPGTLAVNQSICVKHTTSANANSLRKTSLRVGSVVGYFTTRTAP
jgi:hypothetical protein